MTLLDPYGMTFSGITPTSLWTSMDFVGFVLHHHQYFSYASRRLGSHSTQDHSGAERGTPSFAAKICRGCHGTGLGIFLFIRLPLVIFICYPQQFNIFDWATAKFASQCAA